MFFGVLLAHILITSILRIDVVLPYIISLTTVRKALKVGSAIWRSQENYAQTEERHMVLPGANELRDFLKN